MKKLFLLFLLIVPLFLRIANASKDSLQVQIEDYGISKNEKNTNWEYVKDKLFKGNLNREGQTASKFSGPILFSLINAKEKDSLALNQIIENLRKIIPNKSVEYFSKFAKNNYSEYSKSNDARKTKIHGYSYNEIISSTIKISFETDDYGNKRGTNKTEKSLYFSFKEDTNLEDRMKFVQYEVLRTLCFINDQREDELFINLTYPTDAIFNNPTYDVLGKNVTELDEFLIHKLYSDDFEQQFSNYMYKTYPWRYVNLFLNKSLGHLKVYTLIGLVGLLLFIVSFNLFNHRKTTYLNYFFPLLVILLAVSNLHWIYSYFIEIHLPNDSTKNIVLGYVYILISALLLSFLFWFIEQKIINNHLNFTSQFIMKSVLTFSLLHMPFIIGYFLIDKTKSSLPLYAPLFFLFLALTLGRGLLIYLNYFSDSVIKKKEVELSRLKELNAKNELKSLHAHINPHFLYNALNSIASLMDESTEKAENMIISLSDLFRYSINRKNKKMSTIEDEVLMVENYLKIEKIRFGERLKFKIDVKEDLFEKEIPMYILQPLIENAVKHGITDVKTEGEINLEIKENGNDLLIEVSDNGDDFPEDLYSGYGLQSIYDLLRLGYNDKANLNWTNTPKKKITISIPLELL